MEGDPDILRLAQFRHVEMVRVVGAAHVEGVLGAVGAHHAEGGQKLFLLVEIGRAQPAIGQLGGFDDGHNRTSEKGAGRDAAARRTCCLARGRGASCSRAVWECQFSKNSAGFYPKEWRPPGIGCRATVFVGQREIAKNVKSPPALTHRLVSHAGPKEHGKGTAKKHGQKHGGTQMISFRLRILGQTLPFLLIAPLALAQTPASKGPSRAQATAALNKPANPGAAHYTRQQIEQLVAPIGLYQDKLISQVLMGSTYTQT